MVTSGEATSIPYKKIFSSYCFEKQKIVLQIERYGIPSKQIRDQGRETSFKGQCRFVQI